uniref:N-acetylgalactosamine-6-sulfatase-like n=1 Tax=Myxine glutinosa TaxID=7769 RepID=UPI00359028FB
MREPAIAWWPSHIPPGTVNHQLATVMDLFTTSLVVAGVTPPISTPLDGIDLTPALLHKGTWDRPVFYYRGNELMALRYGHYKAHLWTWTNSLQEFHKGIDFCPSQEVRGVTTHNQTDHTQDPILFHLGRDPGEKYPIRQTSKEYIQVVTDMKMFVMLHKRGLRPGQPLLNWCDDAAMNWAPAGCEKLGKCLKVPKSNLQECFWPH